MNKEFSSQDWQSLVELRQTFLGEASERKKDYWTSDELLSLYDQTFAQRIGWKWDNVLSELTAKNDPRFSAAPKVIDYGCGTGMAARKWVQHHSTATAEIFLFDRSSTAMSFAKKKLLEINPALTVHCVKVITDLPENGLLLVSHVVNELPLGEQELLRLLLKSSAAFIWVEPGMKAISELMVLEREKLRDEFQFVAPCPHSGVCGMLDPKNANHWCHHFAKSPANVFTEGFWKKFSDHLKIDLRALPVSYLAAAKPPVAPYATANRIIGRARVYKGYALALLCEETGVEERRILSRHFKETVKRLEDGRFCESLDSKEAER